MTMVGVGKKYLSYIVVLLIKMKYVEDMTLLLNGKILLSIILWIYPKVATCL